MEILSWTVKSCELDWNDKHTLTAFEKMDGETNSKFQQTPWAILLWPFGGVLLSLCSAVREEFYLVT